MVHALRRPEMSGTILVRGKKCNFNLVQAAGRVVHFGCTVELVPGAVVQMSLSQGDDATQIWVRILTRSEEGDGRLYQAKITTKVLTEWLSRRLDTRRSFRVEADPSKEICGLVVLGGRRMRAQLLDASQDGMAVLCSTPLETVSQLGIGGEITLEFPEGRCVFTFRLRRLKGVESKSRMGFEIIDDGSLSYRRSRSFLRNYVMRRQREMARKRTQL